MTADGHTPATPTADGTPTLEQGQVASDADDVRALLSILNGTARTTGAEFFQTLVRHLAEAVGAKYAFIAEFAEVNTRVRTLAYWFRDRFHENVEFDLTGTPCEEVVQGKFCHYPRNVKDLFPGDRPLAEMGIESYLGVPLVDALGATMGHLAVFHDEPMSGEPRRLYAFRIFAARAAAELERLRAERLLRESESRFRDLYEEAPIAYVMEDLESRFVSANRAALRILGIKAEDVPNTVGMSFIPDTPEAQRRVKEAFASIGRGTDTSGVVLELRRKDDGRPIWIQWWSKPEADGKYTRTMFIDITERVLAEQERNRLRQQNAYLQEELKSVHNFEEIIGRSRALTAVLDQVRLVAPTEASVLVTGETGTGKELIARAVHFAGPRRDKPLIKVNCAALPNGLVESELFGHEKGAFTGAISRRIGRFELAEGGTIFLDEIGEIPLDVQAKLLRVLQEREFERVGGTQTIKADVRIIAATNRDLLKAVREKMFREDLYYRLSVFPMALPPLRERPDDVPLLAQFLLNKFMMRVGKNFDGISADALERLSAYSWPGNVRELENVLERAVILGRGPLLEIAPSLLEMNVTTDETQTVDSRGGDKPKAGSLEEIERAHIRAVLDQTGWVIEGPKGAAVILDLHPNTLRSRLKKLGISR